MKEIVFKFFLVFSIFLIGGLSYQAITHNESRDYWNQYSAWVRVYGRPDVTYEDWQTLRNAGLLCEPKKSDVVLEPYNFSLFSVW